MTPTSTKFSATFLDFENIYYFLKNRLQDPPDLNNLVLDLVRNLAEELTKRGSDSLISYAYADFERMATAPQGQLYLMGVSTRNVMGTSHKNAADMQLCIDLMEVMYTRPDISTFVLVAGDRDYIPVLQHLRRQGRTVLVVGFPGSVSGDLLQNIGTASYIDATSLLPAERMEQLRNPVPAPPKPTTAVEALRQAGITASPPPLQVFSVTAPVDFAPVRALITTTQLRTLEIILEELHKLETKQQRRVPELWLGPLMRQLTDEMPELPDYERRDLVNRLRDAGAIRIEKREGNPHPFSVIVVNYNHPDVKRLNPGDGA